MTRNIQSQAEDALRAYDESLNLLQAGHGEGTVCAETDEKLKRLVESFRAVRRTEDAWWNEVHSGHIAYAAALACRFRDEYERWQTIVCPEVGSCIDDMEQQGMLLVYAADFYDCCELVQQRLAGNAKFAANRKVRSAKAAMRKPGPSAAAPGRASPSVAPTPSDSPAILPAVDSSRVRWG